ncbi:MAG: hypothetical protein FJX74_00105 [Armatimonadetes bacterium]|nr:hypothetical protein [Armatimonadota bacterium]
MAERKRQLARIVAQRGELRAFCALIGYRPHRAQWAVHRCGALRRVVRWGRRAGKTLLAAVEAAFCLLQDGKRVWIVAPDHELTGRVWDEVVRILCDVLGFVPTVRHDNPPRKLAFEWGSICEGKSTDPGAQKSLVGAAVDLLIWDEVAKSPGSVWERKLHPNLADRQGRALFISTPEGYNHFHDLWQRGNGGDPAWKSFWAPSSVNPNLPKVALEEARRTYSREAFLQEWEAKFTHFTGQVYSEFDEALHVKPLKYDPDLPLALAIDFGVENPFVCLWVQFTPEDKLLILDEYVERGKTTLENGERLLEHHRQMGYGPIVWAAADPSAKDGRLTLKQHCGLPTVFRRLSTRGDRVGEKRAGIEQIRRLLLPVSGPGSQVSGPTAGRREPETQDPRPETRLYIDPRCKETIREFNLYRYPERAEGRNADEEPEKTDDHCMDALRYAIAVWLARIPERERLKLKANGNGPLRKARDRLMERVRGD